MQKARVRAYRLGLSIALVVAATLAGAGVGPAAADVTAVKGSAYGYLADNISIFGGAQPDTGPVPTVTLPSGGSSSPVTGNAPTGTVKYGPATIFSSGGITVSTKGTMGAGGSVTSSVTISNVNTSQQEVFTASSVSSTCTASESGRSGSTTINSGVLRVSEGNPDVDGDDTNVNIPANPAPNDSREGKIEAVGDTFRYVFNEQVQNADGSITVNAAHLYLLGPTALGDVIIGQSVCGVTAAAGATTTTAAPGATTTTAAPGVTTTTPAPGATTTTAPAATTTTAGQGTTTAAQATTTTAAQATTTAPQATATTASGSTTGVAGGAYGYYVTVSLFGGPASARGPAPAVDLPDGGSASPVADSLGTATAQFGPAILFSSNALEVSTSGTPGGAVTSSARITNVNRSEQEQFTAATLGSTCTATGSEVSGSTTLTGGRLTTSSGSDFDTEGDDTIVDLPGSPAPNTEYVGKIENVGDSFRVVLNEQARTASGITVNAMHMYLLGPTAVGELILGQSRCGTTGGSGPGGSGGGGTLTAATSGGGMASTGAAIAVFVALALVLLVGGSTTTYWVGGVRWRDGRDRRMPWPARTFVR